MDKDNLIKIAFDVVGDGILVLGKDGKIELFNDASVRILGYVIYKYYHEKGKLNLTGVKIGDLLTLKDSNGNVFNPVAEILKIKLPITKDDLTFTDGDGSKTVLYVNLSPVFDKNEAVEKIVMLIRDITAEKELKDRMEEFISVTSHELRTPIAVIEGNLSTALLPNIGKMDDKTKKFVHNAYENTIFLAKIVEDLTTLRKIESGLLPPEDLDTFYPGLLLEELVSQFQKKAEQKKLKLVLYLPKEPVPVLQTSKAKLEQVLVNLIDNAIKYTLTGEISISLSYDIKKDLISISVKDSGIGMKKEHIQKLFSRFFRVEDWRTRESGGTGLGLYISKKVLEHLGGKITVESEFEKGSTFTVVLPVNPIVRPH